MYVKVQFINEHNANQNAHLVQSSQIINFFRYAKSFLPLLFRVYTDVPEKRSERLPNNDKDVKLSAFETARLYMPFVPQSLADVHADLALKKLQDESIGDERKVWQTESVIFKFVFRSLSSIYWLHYANVSDLVEQLQFSNKFILGSFLIQKESRCKRKLIGFWLRFTKDTKTNNLLRSSNL